MKKQLLSAILILMSITAVAQDKDSSLLYLQFPDIPPLKLYTLPDSTLFTKDNLKKKKPVMIMIFSPDCDHCKHQTQEILDNIEAFKKIQIVMATPVGYRYIKAFYETYKLNELPNFIVGQDPGYFLGTFYKIKNFPSMFLYNKKGEFITKFEGNASASAIIQAFEE